MFSMQGDRDGEIALHIEENNAYMNKLSSFREVGMKQFGNAANC